MRVRFQADADLDARIILGLKRRQPEIDFQSSEAANLREVPDPEVLRIAAASGRILVTQDQRTMPRHFAEFITARVSASVIVVPQSMAIGVAVEELHLVWEASDASEWTNRLVWIPL